MKFPVEFKKPLSCTNVGIGTVRVGLADNCQSWVSANSDGYTCFCQLLLQLLLVDVA